MTASILIAGGGTGGHVFPGLAVAHVMKRLADVEIVFAGSPRGLEAKMVPDAGFSLELLDVEPMKGGGAARAVRGALVAARAMRHAASFVRKLRPRVVLSVGGYAAGPAALACVSQGVPLAILEPNSVLGLANRLLAPFARRAYAAWPEVARIFRSDKSRIYGVPLRPGFSPSPLPHGDHTRVLVLGGSQGAAPLNDRVPPALALAAGGHPGLRVVHQAGRDRHPRVARRYVEAGLKGVEVTSFLEDVATGMTNADLVIARAGAVTLAEIAAIGRPAILVPYPRAADDHQAKNAIALAKAGAAVCLLEREADPERLAREISALLDDDARRERMAEAARAHGRPHAAEDVARDLLALAGIALRKSKSNGANGASAHHRSAKELS